MGKKYKLLKDQFITLYSGETLYRIKALKDFGDVKKGDIGGFIKSENNLSQKGKCWVYDDARVNGCALVYNNAKIRNNAKIYGYAMVFDNAEITNNANVYDNSSISGNARIHDCARIYDTASIGGNANVYGNSRICGFAKLSGNVIVFDDAYIHDATIKNSVEISDKAKISGDICIDEFNLKIGYFAKIESKYDYIILRNFLKSNITIYRCCSGVLILHDGIAFYTIKEYTKFISKFYHGKEKIILFMLVKMIKYYFKETKNK